MLTLVKYIVQFTLKCETMKMTNCHFQGFPSMIRISRIIIQIEKQMQLIHNVADCIAIDSTTWKTVLHVHGGQHSIIYNE